MLSILRRRGQVTAYGTHHGVPVPHEPLRKFARLPDLDLTLLVLRSLALCNLWRGRKLFSHYIYISSYARSAKLITHSAFYSDLPSHTS